MIYTYLLILVSGINFFATYINNKYLKLSLFILLIYILVMFVGLGIPSGGDWYNYVNVFESLNTYEQIYTYVHPKEPLYLLLNLLVKEITDNYFVFFTLISFIFISITFYSYKQYTKYYFLIIKEGF